MKRILLPQNYLKILISFILVGCTPSKHLTESIPKIGKMELLMVNSYKSYVDTAQSTIQYKDLKLKQVVNKDRITWIHELDTVFIGDRNKYELLFEVFDSTFLVISYIIGDYSYFGPGVFRRDNILFYDLNTRNLYYSTTVNTFIESSKERFINQYCKNGKSKFLSMSRVIDHLDLTNYLLVLIKANCQNELHTLYKCVKPYIIN